VVYEFRAHPQFADVTDFSGKTGALAVLFEDRYCAECARFHATTLSDPRVTEEMKRFVFVRLDAESNRPIVGLDGKPTTPAQWAKSLGLSYRPAIVLFNEGRELFRADGRLYHLHFEEALRYVGGGYYGQFDTIGQFRAAYRAERLERGVDIDYAE